jgi:predicted MFS family arabinose efflux permease
MGRRPAFFIYLLIESVFAIATAFAPTFGIWLACRIGVGFTVPAIMGTPFVMGTIHIHIRIFFLSMSLQSSTIIHCLMRVFESY